MKKNSKKIGRLLVKGVIYLAMFGLFAGFVVFHLLGVIIGQSFLSVIPPLFDYFLYSRG